MKIVRHDNLAELLADDYHEAWLFYLRTFDRIDELAAQRHLMTQDEFDHVALDPRVQKYLAVSDGGRLVGMSTITNDLDAWPMVSPRYFAKHWPDRYERRAIWYIGFVGVSREGRREHAFRELITTMYPQVADSDGMTVMDYCAYNADVMNMPGVTIKLLQSINPTATGGRIDTQGFYAYEFAPGSGPGTA